MTFLRHARWGLSNHPIKSAYGACARFPLDPGLKYAELERQVGSRYFVSASNASKIFFLAKVSVEFLEYSGKDSGNNLERIVYKKL